MSLKLPPLPAEWVEVTFTEQQLNVKSDHMPFLPFQDSDVFNADLKTATYLTQGDDVKTVVDICVDIKASGIKYEPGGTFAILPQNNSTEVNEIINRLQYNEVADRYFELSVKKIVKSKKVPKLISLRLPYQGTIRDFLLNYLDIRSVPKKAFLRSLSQYVSDKKEVNDLHELCSLQGSTKYNDLITSEYMTLLKLLKKFPSCLPPFSLLIEHLPNLCPRPYSVSSSPLASQSEVHFIFSLSLLPNGFEGICTSWLNKKAQNLKEKPEQLNMYLRKLNHFKLPADNSKNIIMICAGAGIAPFLSFIQHRALQKRNVENIGDMYLFFGCRYSERDFIHKNEIQHYLDTGVLTKLFTSFSREKSEIKYVQHQIRANVHEFLKMLDNDAVIYICGGAQMCKDVRNTILDLFNEFKMFMTCTFESADEFLQQLKCENRYLEDVWF